MHDAGFEQSRAGGKENAGRRILDAHCRTPIDAAAEPFLIERPHRDADQRDRRRGPRERRRAAGRNILPHEQIDTEKTEDEADPLPRRDALAEPAIGESRCQHRLQADDEGRERRRKAVFNRDEDAADIKAVHHQAGQHAVHDAGPVGPFRTRDKNNEAQQQHHAKHAQREECHRFGVWQPELAADKAGRPEHDENAGSRENGEILERAGHVLVRRLVRVGRQCGRPMQKRA